MSLAARCKKVNMNKHFMIMTRMYK